MKKAVFFTERLYFKEFTPDDSADLMRLHSIPEVLKYVGMPLWYEIGDAINYILLNTASYQQYGYGRWGVYLTKNDEFIGLAGILNSLEGDYIDLGYRFFPGYWGRGYATESVSGIISYAFQSLNLKEIVGYAKMENLGSQKVMLKAGMCDMGEGICMGLSARKFVISKAQYAENRLL